MLRARRAIPDWIVLNRLDRWSLIWDGKPAKGAAIRFVAVTDAVVAGGRKGGREGRRTGGSTCARLVLNPDRLSELKIARFLGADGIRPYLSRQTQYRVNADGANFRRSDDTDIRDVHVEGWMPTSHSQLFKARPGDCTW